MMFADNSNSSTSKPTFASSEKIENLYEKILIENISIFLNDLQNQVFTKPLNKFDEFDYNQVLVSTITTSLYNNPRGVQVQSDYRDIYTPGANSQKKPDICFISCVNGASKKPLYAVEAKRLPTGKSKRKKEYVTGYTDKGSPKGGIIRFKTGDHGYGLRESALIGYIEENSFDHWYITINGWIKEEAGEIASLWNTTESLKKLVKDDGGNYAKCYSLARRNPAPNIKLFHLWIVIPNNLNYSTV